MKFKRKEKQGNISAKVITKTADRKLNVITGERNI